MLKKHDTGGYFPFTCKLSPHYVVQWFFDNTQRWFRLSS